MPITIQPTFQADEFCFFPKIWCNYTINVVPVEILENHYLEGIVCEVVLDSEGGIIESRELCGIAYSAANFCEGVYESQLMHFNQIIKDDKALNSGFKDSYSNYCKKYIFKIREVYDNENEPCGVIRGDYQSTNPITILNFANPDYDPEFYQTYCPRLTAGPQTPNELGQYLNDVGQVRTYCNTTPVELCLFVPDRFIGQQYQITYSIDGQVVPPNQGQITNSNGCILCFNASPANVLGIPDNYIGQIVVLVRLGTAPFFRTERIVLNFECCEDHKLFCYLNSQGVYDYIESSGIKEIGITTEGKYKCVSKSIGGAIGSSISVAKNIDKTLTVFFDKNKYNENDLECFFSAQNIYCGERNERTGLIDWFVVTQDTNDFSIFRSSNESNKEFRFTIEKTKATLTL